jgi:hypothetical protein
MGLHVAFLACLVLVAWWLDRPLTTAGVVLGVALLLAPLSLRRGSVLLGYDRARAAVLFERSMQHILAPYEIVHDGFLMALKSGPVHIRIVQLPGRMAWLRFIAARKTPKLELLRRLLIKEFRTVLPRPNFRLPSRLGEP